MITIIKGDLHRKKIAEFQALTSEVWCPINNTLSSVQSIVCCAGDVKRTFPPGLDEMLHKMMSVLKKGGAFCPPWGFSCTEYWHSPLTAYFFTAYGVLIKIRTVISSSCSVPAMWQAHIFYTHCTIPKCRECAILILTICMEKLRHITACIKSPEVIPIQWHE